MRDANRSSLDIVARRLRGSGKQVASLSYDIVTQFFALREDVVEPAIEGLRTQLDQVVKSKVSWEYLQTPRGSGWRMAGIRYAVMVPTDDDGMPARCEIEFTASAGENSIRVRAARGALLEDGGKEVRLYPRQFSTKTVQRVFGNLLVECLVDDFLENPAGK